MAEQDENEVIEEEEEECPKCPPVGAPAWMATFADMATLLMAFFVLILSFAEFNVPKFKQILSIDSYKPKVAQIALENGFNMINDISGGGKNGSMIEVASLFNCPIIIMHMKGNPENMQNNPNYHNVMDEIISFFELRLEHANKIGLNVSNIILDPGIGFGKRIEDNDTILTNIAELKITVREITSEEIKSRFNFLKSNFHLSISGDS